MKALRLVATAAACGFLINSATADIPYFDAYGLVTVNGQPAQGVTVEIIPCTGATLPADWPVPSPSLTTTQDGGTNYAFFFVSGNGNGGFPGPAGSFTFQSPANGAWYTGIDAQLRFTTPGCTPVTVSCADVRAAFQASLATDHVGVPQINVDIPCGQPPPPPPPTTLVSGDTVTIGFWKNKNGQALIRSLNGGGASTALGDWLASNFPYLFGANAGSRNLAGKSNLAVASLYAKLAGIKGPKPDAQLMATALSVYVTDSDLAGNAGAKYDFNISADGTGAKTFNVGLLGSAIGIANNSSVSVMDLLLQANAQKQAGTYNTRAFGALFEAINESGEEEDLLLLYLLY